MFDVAAAAGPATAARPAVDITAARPRPSHLVPRRPRLATVTPTRTPHPSRRPLCRSTVNPPETTPASKRAWTGLSEASVRVTPSRAARITPGLEKSLTGNCPPLGSLPARIRVMAGAFDATGWSAAEVTPHEFGLPRLQQRRRPAGLAASHQRPGPLQVRERGPVYRRVRRRHRPAQRGRGVGGQPGAGRLGRRAPAARAFPGHDPAEVGIHRGERLGPRAGQPPRPLGDGGRLRGPGRGGRRGRSPCPRRRPPWSAPPRQRPGPTPAPPPPGARAPTVLQVTWAPRAAGEDGGPSALTFSACGTVSSSAHRQGECLGGRAVVVPGRDRQGVRSGGPSGSPTRSPCRCPCCCRSAPGRPRSGSRSAPGNRWP